MIGPLEIRQKNKKESMKITFKLYATLQHLLPATAVNNAVEIDVADDVTLYQLIDKFGVNRKDAHLVLINGAYINPEDRDRSGVVVENDVIAIWPPVAGG